MILKIIDRCKDSTVEIYVESERFGICTAGGRGSATTAEGQEYIFSQAYLMNENGKTIQSISL